MDVNGLCLCCIFWPVYIIFPVRSGSVLVGRSGTSWHPCSSPCLVQIIPLQSSLGNMVTSGYSSAAEYDIAGITESCKKMSHAIVGLRRGAWKPFQIWCVLVCYGAFESGCRYKMKYRDDLGTVYHSIGLESIIFDHARVSEKVWYLTLLNPNSIFFVKGRFNADRPQAILRLWVLAALTTKRSCLRIHSYRPRFSGSCGSSGTRMWTPATRWTTS